MSSQQLLVTTSHHNANAARPVQSASISALFRSDRDINCSGVAQACLHQIPLCLNKTPSAVLNIHKILLVFFRMTCERRSWLRTKESTLVHKKMFSSKHYAYFQPAAGIKLQDPSHQVFKFFSYHRTAQALQPAFPPDTQKRTNGKD